jgi:uncharacterized protein (TIGR02996 family)
MTADEQAFHAAIAAAPADAAVHGAYADWLDEHDRPEEADWHRAWTTAKRAAALAWLAEFAADHYHDDNYPNGPWDDETYEQGRPLTAAQVIEAGHEWLRTLEPDSWDGKLRGEYFTQMGAESLRNWMVRKDNRQKFWRNWALATGTYVPAETAEDGYVFSCSC